MERLSNSLRTDLPPVFSPQNLLGYLSNDARHILRSYKLTVDEFVELMLEKRILQKLLLNQNSKKLFDMP